MTKLFFFLSLLGTLSAAPASADSLTKQWNVPTKLALAQCLVAETGWGYEVEKAAVAHVLVKRWVMINGHRTVSLLKTVRAYCAIHHRNGGDAKRPWIKQLRWSTRWTPKSCGRLCSDNWPDVMHFVNRFATGRISDPLPTSAHYGNEDDHRNRVLKGKLGRVRLLPRTITHEGSIVRLQNLFYAFQ